MLDLFCLFILRELLFMSKISCKGYLNTFGGTIHYGLLF